MFSLLRYEHDTDKTLTQLTFIGADNERIGVLNWFAVHPTSMNNTNKLVSSDNVGYAAVLFEKQLNPGSYVGHGKVVTAFASANLGDSSPNINGPKCEYSGLPCDLLTSTCRPNEGACFASGPGRDQFESCKIIGARIYHGANELLERNTARELSGPINYIHQFIDMSTAKAKFLNTTNNQFEEVRRFILTLKSTCRLVCFTLIVHLKQVRGCSPAMGYSFAAGTTDGK